MSSINTINIALTGMMSNQKALEVTGHNVANVNTEGYHRQQVIMQALPPYPPAGVQGAAAGGQYGTGVDIASVRRLQDTFLQQQAMQTAGQLSQWQANSSSLQQIESILAPGPGLGISDLLDQFFGSWQQLASQPENLATRQTVRSAAVSLANGLNQTVGQLDFNATQITTQIHSDVDRLNMLADQVAQLNAQIGMARAENRDPNDYLDQRGMLLAEMTQLAGVSTLSVDEASSIITVGGRALVEGSVAHHLSLQSGAGATTIRWEDGTIANISGGEIAGLLSTRDTVIPDYRAQLDAIASALNTAVNGLHATGVTMDDLPAGTFFTGTTAGSIRVTDAILADARKIAATTQVNAAGDGSLATDIYGLYTAQLVGNQTLGQASQSIIGQIGNAVQTAKTQVEINAALKGMQDNQEKLVSGVSLDEELANMLIYQRAFAASARMLTTADQMMQTVIEMMGR